MMLLLEMLFVVFTSLLPNILHKSQLSAETFLKLLPVTACPSCGFSYVIKNDSIHNGKPKSECKDCGRRFANNPNNVVVPSEIKQFIDKLLLERISLRGIARVTGVFLSWLQNYVHDKFTRTSR